MTYKPNEQIRNRLPHSPNPLFFSTPNHPFDFLRLLRKSMSGWKKLSRKFNYSITRNQYPKGEFILVSVF